MGSVLVLKTQSMGQRVLNRLEGLFNRAISIESSICKIFVDVSLLLVCWRLVVALDRVILRTE